MVLGQNWILKIRDQIQTVDGVANHIVCCRSNVTR